MTVPVSILILTKNEEQDLPRCLAALRWCEDVHLVDSGSTDGTLEIARHHGVRIHEHAFVSFGDQRNWALDHCDIKHPWILFLDADEVATGEFVQTMAKAVADAPYETAGFYCCWKMIYDGRWLKRCDSFPKWQFRLLRKGRGRFTDFGHGQKEGKVDGVIEYLRTPYDHHALSKGLSHWLDRHNRYSTLEARARLAVSVRWADVFSHHGSVRNKAMKPLVSRLPGWPLLRFLMMYVFKLGFLEGRPGFVYCVNLAYYEFLIKAKMREEAAKQKVESEK
jgi:glycosyltransferase involved in cell wall biosynthesis